MKKLVLLRALCRRPDSFAVTPFTHSYWPIYAVTPFRLDGLAAGSLLALSLEESQPGLSRIAGKILAVSGALIGTLCAMHLFVLESNRILFNTFAYSLTSLFAVSLLAWVLLEETSLISRILENRSIVFLGLISYGLYLYHGFALTIGNQVADRIGMHTHPGFLLPLSLVLAITFSWLSFRFYERPIMDRGRLFADSMRRIQNRELKNTEAYSPVAE